MGQSRRALQLRLILFRGSHPRQSRQRRNSPEHGRLGYVSQPDKFGHIVLRRGAGSMESWPSPLLTLGRPFHVRAQRDAASARSESDQWGKFSILLHAANTRFRQAGQIRNLVHVEPDRNVEVRYTGEPMG